MRPRLREIDKPLAGVVLVLAAYGLATLYSAGQTDVPTFVATIWHRQTIWLAIGAAAMFLMFGLSPRLLEWATPYAYAITVLVLVFGLLLWWRPYVWEGLTIMLANIVMGIIAVPFWRRLAPYQQNRLLAFLNPEVDPRATGWHVLQSKIAIGSGGFLGKGFTAGPQKRLAFLPAQHTDFIFPVVGEELGFLGVVIALALFVFLVLSLLRIARRATDAFSSLCVFGIASLIFSHIVENVGMTVNLLPITGIPLPFFSYGGSFMLACSLAVGIALRVAWESRQSGYAEL